MAYLLPGVIYSDNRLAAYGVRKTIDFSEGVCLQLLNIQLLNKLYKSLYDIHLDGVFVVIHPRVSFNCFTRWFIQCFCEKFIKRTNDDVLQNSISKSFYDHLFTGLHLIYMYFNIRGIIKLIVTPIIHNDFILSICVIINTRELR